MDMMDFYHKYILLFMKVKCSIDLPFICTGILLKESPRYFFLKQTINKMLLIYKVKISGKILSWNENKDSLRLFAFSRQKIYISILSNSWKFQLIVISSLNIRFYLHFCRNHLNNRKTKQNIFIWSYNFRSIKIYNAKISEIVALHFSLKRTTAVMHI